MIRRTVTIKNTLGLHARPAALFVQTAARFKCDVFVERDDIRVSGKSIMGIMMLAAEHGSRITIETEGRDDQECMDVLTALVTSDFEAD
ncbi:MAG: HPr family phosphocarrier protein [Candidatus Latescibacteria bacterium]|nr:HPr family phosphocarrier protein [Candidatus Latescibacterota bacterium]